jgi:hypothetical protein
VRLRSKPLLVDTNLILEAHKCGCWKQIVGAFRVETVAKCVEETQTGKQRTTHKVNIDEAALRRSIEVHHVTPDEVFRVKQMGGAGLDAGEMELWAHALTRVDAWVLCGPDTASLKFGFDTGHKDRLVHLEAVLAEIGVRMPRNIASHFGRRWHEHLMNEMIFGRI